MYDFSLMCASSRIVNRWIIRAAVIKGFRELKFVHLELCVLFFTYFVPGNYLFLVKDQLV